MWLLTGTLSLSVSAIERLAAPNFLIRRDSP